MFCRELALMDIYFDSERNQVSIEIKQYCFILHFKTGWLKVIYILK